MKSAYFLHGTGGSPKDHWWPWLRSQFEASGFDVRAPLLPDSNTPNRNTYWNFLQSQNWNFNDSVLVGHSSGATSVLNLLSRDEFPKVKAAILIGVFLNEDLTKKSSEFVDSNQFEGLFPKDGFDWSAIKAKADKIYVVHSDDDPYCSYDDAHKASMALGAQFIPVLGGGHLTTRFGISTLPSLIAVLKKDNLL